VNSVLWFVCALCDVFRVLDLICCVPFVMCNVLCVAYKVQCVVWWAHALWFMLRILLCVLDA